MTAWAFGEFPGSWKQAFHPRRGGVEGPRIVLDAKAPAKVAALVAERRKHLEHAFGDQESEPVLVDSARAWLAGEPDPRGAAAVYGVLTGGRNLAAGMFLDAWIAEHGTAFAVRSVAELASVQIAWRSISFQARETIVKGGRIRHAVHGFQRQWDPAAALRLRALLAAADDSLYTEAAALLTQTAERGVFHQALAAYLVPTETALTDAACANFPDRATEDWLVWCSAGTPGQLATAAARIPLGRRTLTLPVLTTLADAHGERAVPLLAEALDVRNPQSNRRTILSVLSRIATDEVFAILTGLPPEGDALAALGTAMECAPGRAVEALGRTSSPVHLRLLRGHLLAHPDLLDGDLPEAVAAFADGLRRRPTAPPGELPDLLTAPPWTRPRRKTTATVLALTPPAEASIHWNPGEREDWLQRWDTRGDGPPPATSPLTGDGGSWSAIAYANSAPDDLVRPQLAAWNPAGSYWGGLDDLGTIAARFEVDALPPLRRAAASSPVRDGVVLAPYLEIETARLMADWLVRLKSARLIAVAWLRRHGEGAARLLVPDATGAPGPARTAAEAALRVLPAERVRSAAAGYGTEAAGAIDDLLARDPLDDLPVKMPVPGAWADPVRLPQIRLAGGDALPDEAAGHVLMMLALSRPGEPYPGLTAVRELADPASLAEFGWEVFESWRLAGAPAKDNWALTGLGFLGDDGTVRRLTPIVRAWPGEGGHAKAVLGLDVLAGIGTETALQHLHGIAQRVPFKGLKERAREKIAQVAETLGLTGEQLGDRLVPDFGLEPDGALTLDYGPRRFRVGFDEQLRPYVLDGDGKRRKDLPAPGVKDDPELAPEAKKRFAQMKKDVRTVAADQIRRLEQAMVDRRSWPVAEFRELLAGHPLLRHLVRRLVWTDGGTAFRVAEDGTLADAGDTALTLPDSATVRIAHPLDLGGALPAWSGLFADYELLQPFPQLGRPLFTLPATGFAAFEGATVPTGRLLGLTKRGWLRGSPQDAGVEPVIYRPLPGGTFLTIDLEPGIAVGAVGEFPDQKLLAVRVSARRDDSWGTGSLPPAGVDPLLLSEVLSDLTGLVS
ncbi:hypothetical protein GCM10010468_02990 [Actinocorallia longicatena]|uniref:DUF4132 domain-containing protein n=1 Tax=Actinocorallia longicatena TaxID=111803 RepID=A0ABP6PWM6_9ACTN